MNQPQITPELVASHGLKPDEYERILKLIGRVPSFTELGIFSAMWNEHCSYKSSRLHLRGLPTSAPWVIQGPGENAGVIDIGDGQAVVFKMESHNHPSYIEPYQGATTGVGGILRDVFTMGARPIACLNALSFGAPEHPKTRHLVSGVVAGVGGYGNSFGVPTVGGQVRFHTRYDGNILVNAMAVGLADTDKIFYAAASGVNMPIVYLGSKTGRDGIHGASMASAEFDDDSAEKRPTVQVGDPFAEKLLLEACLEIMAADCVIAIQDMGAAGLTCSAVEMGAKGDLGVDLDLDAVPTRETGMSAYEMMLSESQERMLMVLKPEKEKQAEAIFRKWGLDFAVVGYTTPSKRFVVKHGGDVMADLPIKELGDEAPLYDRPHVPSQPLPVIHARDVTPPVGVAAALEKLIASGTVVIAGFQGVSYRKEITTLGRGGSDTTAVAMAAALNAEYCEICSDVDGVYSAIRESWPPPVASARCRTRKHRRWPSPGAKVLNAQAVEFAKEKGIAIYARATSSPCCRGTIRQPTEQWFAGTRPGCPARSWALRANATCSRWRPTQTRTISSQPSMSITFPASSLHISTDAAHVTLVISRENLHNEARVQAAPWQLASATASGSWTASAR